MVRLTALVVSVSVCLVWVSVAMSGVCGVRIMDRLRLRLGRLKCPISARGYHEFRVAGYELLALKRNADAKRCFEAAMALYMTRIGQYHSNVRPSDVEPEAMNRANALTRQVQQSMGLISTIDTRDGKSGDPYRPPPRVGPAQYPGAGTEYDRIADAAANDTSPLQGLAPHQMPVPLTVDARPPPDAMKSVLDRLRQQRIESDNRKALDDKRRAAGLIDRDRPLTEAERRAADPLSNRFWDDRTIQQRVGNTYDHQLEEQRRMFDDD